MQIRCAQALGLEIYVGCSNGELLRYTIQAGGSSSVRPYSLSACDRLITVEFAVVRILHTTLTAKRSKRQTDRRDNPHTIHIACIRSLRLVHHSLVSPRSSMAQRIFQIDRFISTHYPPSTRFLLRLSRSDTLKHWPLMNSSCASLQPRVLRVGWNPWISASSSAAQSHYIVLRTN